MNKTPKHKREYAVYKGDECLAIGTARQCAKELGIKPRTIEFMASGTGQRRFKARKNPEKCRTAFLLTEQGAT